MDDEIRLKYAAHLEKYEKSHMGGFRKIYPNDNEELYAKFFNQSTSLCAETAASRARCELSKLQREDIAAKQKELESIKKRFSGQRSVAGKSDVRPESPAAEKRRPKEVAVRRRIPSFRIPLYHSQTGSRASSATAGGERKPAATGGEGEESSQIQTVRDKSVSKN